MKFYLFVISIYVFCFGRWKEKRKKQSKKEFMSFLMIAKELKGSDDE